MKRKFLKLNLYLGVGVFILSCVLLYLESSFMKNWFYVFAWWSFIFFLDSVNFRKTNHSPLSDDAFSFVFLAFMSVPVWLVFELFNLRLQNWTYHELPEGLWPRWLGYFLAFSTVVPALKELADFFGFMFKNKSPSLFHFKSTSSVRTFFLFLGTIFFFLPLLWPDLFFPLVWLCFIFLLEPLNTSLKLETVTSHLADKEWTRLWSWMAAGLTAGILWEFWNFFAESHWEYSLPYLNIWKIFQMPLLGYLGFVPFAVELFLLYQIILWVYNRLHQRSLFFILLCVAFLLFDFGCFFLIDAFSVVP